MSVLYIDFETRSALDLKEVGLWNYVRHPTTEPWCMAWALDDQEPQLWTPSDDNAPFLDYVEGNQIVAHNAAFELAVWNQIMVPRYGWPELKPEQTYCTLAAAYAMGLPGSLEDAAMAMGLHVLKDKEGRALMLRMARPRRVRLVPPEHDGATGYEEIVWWDDPDKLARLYEYCKQDVRVERELHKRLMPLSEQERRIWLLDYKINQRGVAIDRPSVEAAIRMTETLKADYDRQMAEATGGAVETCSALIPLKEWAVHCAGRMHVHGRRKA